MEKYTRDVMNKERICPMGMDRYASEMCCIRVFCVIFMEESEKTVSAEQGIGENTVVHICAMGMKNCRKS